MPSHRYFSFGSNMDRRQMKKRTPGAEYIGVGCIEGHDIVFNRKGSYRPGGVASIIPSLDSAVYGIVWGIDENELRKLDEIEDTSAYERVLMPVVVNNSNVDCFVYIAYPQDVMTADQEYLEIIIRAAESAELPAEWVKRLKEFRVNNPQYK